MATKNFPMRIVTGLAGWVWVARVERQGDEFLLHESRCIRRWGKPLAELANSGPGASTVLEEALNGVKRLNILAVIAQDDCEERNWK